MLRLHEVMERLVGAVPLVITLVKSKKKGHMAAVHKYLVRFEVVKADGSTKWEYVYPPTHTIETFDAAGGLKLKPGTSVSKIINEFMFGSYGVHEDGTPWVKNGYFFDYKPVLNTKALTHKPHKDPIDVNNLGKWKFYKFRRHPGYVYIETGNGVEKVYTMPAKVTDLQLKDDDAITHAQGVAPGAGIKEGAKPFTDNAWEKKTGGSTHDVMPGAVSIFNTPVESLDTKNALAAKLKDKVEDMPEWVVDKFGKQKFIDELQQRPVTTSITLGTWDPKDKTAQQSLYNEWVGTIRNIAKKKADAYKVTNTYAAWKQMDEDAGRDYTNPHSSERNYLNTVTDELSQDGAEALWNAANAYKPDRDNANDRFDKFAFGYINNHISQVSRKQAMADGAGFAIVHEEDSDNAAYKQGSQAPLTPEESYELKEYTGPARVALMRAVNDPSMPEAYRRVFTARLWLDDLSVEERTLYEKKEARAASGIAKEVSTKTKNTWMRPLSGKDSVVSKYPTWVDPGTGQVVDLASMSEVTQRNKLGDWYNAAQLAVLSNFTAGGKLTHEGRVVKRWLELEAKLASSNRRTFNESEHHTIKYEPIKPENMAPLRTVSLQQHPAVQFFNQSENQKLAQDLNINLAAVHAHGHYESGIKLGTGAQSQLDAASRHHATLVSRSSWSTKEISDKISGLHDYLGALKDAGEYSSAGFSGHVWTPGTVTKFHDAAMEYQHHMETARAKKDNLRALRKEYKAVGKKVPQEEVDNFALHPHELDAAEKAHGHMVAAAKQVALVAPKMVSEYAGMLEGGVHIDQDNMAQHKSAITQAANGARAELTLLQFEKNRRKVIKSCKLVGTAQGLFKVFNDLDFELGLLRVKMEVA